MKPLRGTKITDVENKCYDEWSSRIDLFEWKTSYDYDPTTIRILCPIYRPLCHFILMEHQIFMAISFLTLKAHWWLKFPKFGTSWGLISSIHTHFGRSMSNSTVVDRNLVNTLGFFERLFDDEIAPYSTLHIIVIIRCRIHPIFVRQHPIQKEFIDIISTWSTVEFKIECIKGVYELQPYSMLPSFFHDVTEVSAFIRYFVDLKWISWHIWRASLLSEIQ